MPDRRFLRCTLGALLKNTVVTVSRHVCLWVSGGSLGSRDALYKPFHWLAWLAAALLAAAALLLFKAVRSLEGLPVEWGEAMLTCVGSQTGHGEGAVHKLRHTFFSGMGGGTFLRKMSSLCPLLPLHED